jgi:hypothetical protein
MSRKKNTPAAKEVKPRKPEVPKIPTLLKDFMQGKATSQSLKMEAIDLEGIQALAVKFPEFKAVSFKDVYRLAVRAATAPAVSPLAESLHQELLKQLDSLEAKYIATKAELDSANAFLQAAQAQYRNAFTEDYHTLKEETQTAIPALMGILDLKGGKQFILTNADFISLLVDYCKRDPSEEFPFEPALQPIIKRYTDATTQPLAQTVSTENTTTEAGTGGTEDEGAKLQPVFIAGGEGQE